MAIAVSAIVGQSWPALVAMVVGMSVGAVFSMFLGMAAAPLFGVFEIFLPVMSTSMVAGMIIGMAAAIRPLILETAAAGGALIGLVVMIVIYVMNDRIRSQGKEWTS